MASESVVEAVAEESVQNAFTRALTNFKGTVSYEKKVNDGNFGSDQYGIFVQFDYAPDAESDDFLAEARDALNLATIAVLERLGLQFYRDDEGVVRQVMQEFPGSTVESQGQASPSTNVPLQPPWTEAQIKAMSSDDAKSAKRDVRQWAEDRLAAAPGEFFDNRATKTGRQPDYRHKKFGHAAVWLD